MATNPFTSSVAALTETLLKSFALTPIFGFEREFYLQTADGSFAHPDDAKWKKLLDATKAQGIFIEALKEEDGTGQYEICMAYAPVKEALKHYYTLTHMLADWAKEHALNVVLLPRVEDDQPSSALHVHVHLEDAQRQNVFTKDEDELSQDLANCLAGLLAFLPASMPLFAPDEISYQRYREWEKYTPSKIAWGNNNRTTPLRLPATEKPTLYRHIEHRVAASHADAEAVSAAILAGLCYGLQKKPNVPECVFGDARERNHPELADMPKTLEEARASYQSDTRLQDYLQPEAKAAMKASTEAQSASSG